MGSLFIVETVFLPRFLTRAAFGRLRRRDQLRHSLQVIGVLLLFPGEGRAVRARGARGWGGRRAGGGAGALHAELAGAGARAAGPNSPRTRRGGGARLQVCNARAPRRVCVPAFPFLPRQSVLWSDSAASGHRSPSLSEQLPSPRRLAAAHSLAGSEEQRRPRAGARVPAQDAPESEPGAERASRAVTAAAQGGCRPRPPAAQALPLFSPPPCSIPHALQGNQTGLQPLRRREPPPQSDWVPSAFMGRRLCVPGAQDGVPRTEPPGRRAGAAGAPGLGRSLQVSRAPGTFPAALRMLRPGWTG